MRALATADVHLEKATHGKLIGGRSSRLTDFAATLLKFAEKAVELDVDLAVIAGDLFDTRRPGPEAIHAAVVPLGVLSQAKIRTVVVPGNHDGMGTIADPTSHTLTWMAALEMPYVHVFNEPRVGIVGTKSGEITIVSVPFPHKRAYDVEHADKEMLERVELVSRDVEKTIEYMLSKATVQPVVFVGHLTVVGGLLGPQKMMRTGWDVSISADVLEKADFALLGHLHPQQAVRPNVWYAGSPDYHEFGEEGPKGFLLVDLEQHQVQSIPSNPRPMVVVDVAETPPHVGLESMGMGPNDRLPPMWPALSKVDVADATVLLRLRPSEAPKVAASVLAEYRRQLYEAGAFLVKDETIVPEMQRRARVEIDPEVDEIAAVERWAIAKGIDPARVMPVAEELMTSFRAESTDGG